MSSLSWSQRFGISDRELGDLQNHLQASGEDPLRWVLLNGHVDQREYLKWAMDSYQIPFVKDSYFQIPADLPFWEAVRNDFAWTPGFLPLAEWQGVLLIGCLEPPRFHFPLRSAHRFVLVQAAQLEQRYNEYTGAIEKKAKVAIAEPVQEVRQRPLDEFLADSLPPAPDVSLENPDGLVHEIAPASTPNLFVVPDGLTTNDLGQPVSSLPDGFTEAFADGTSVTDFSSLDENSPTEAAYEAPTITPPPPPVIVAAPAKAPIVPPAPPKIVLTPRPSATPRATPQVAPSVNLAARAIDSTVSTPQAPSIGVAKTSVVSQSATAVPLETCATYDALGVAAIGHILKQFEHGVVLLFQGGELRPWKWTEMLLSVKGDSPDAIPLEPASIFRIAYRTCLPYHGHVVTNPTNAAFFNAFNRGILPKHATVIPILNNGDLVGMLMGLATEKVDYKASLIAMEKLASEFGTNLNRMRAAGVAAA